MTGSQKRKEVLKAELIERLKSELAVLEQAQSATQEAATHEEAKPENSKDTRAIEQSYLARGQAARIEAVREALAGVRAMSLKLDSQDRPAGIGAIVSVEEEDGAERTFFIAPYGGATTLSGGVQVITPQSPIGRALIGRVAGEACELQSGGRKRELWVTRLE